MMFPKYPERNLAARLVAIKNLSPPLDIFSLAKQYAKVEALDMPFDIDGISLNLKVPGKQPHIIINSESTHRRMRFTLAHELGHVVIPWHTGSIIDKTTPPNEDKFDEYWHIEAEANRFASELLMPSEWVKKVIQKKNNNLYKITNYLTEKADVSSHAATIQIKDTIAEGYIFAALTDAGKVIFSGKSEGTLAPSPEWGKTISPEKLFPFCQDRFDFEINGFYYYWWYFSSEPPIPDKATIGDWRIIIDEIINDINVPVSERKYFKQSINGVIAYANSQVRGKKRTPEALYSAVLQRTYGRTELKKFVKHPKFESFIFSKIDSLLGR